MADINGPATIKLKVIPPRQGKKIIAAPVFTIAYVRTPGRPYAGADAMRADGKTEILLQALIDVVWTAHKLRAVGGRTGAVNAAGGGSWGVLHTLVQDGPKTVPQIARMRPVARQHIQTLVNELAADGLVEFCDNPAHKRSRLVVVTTAGRSHYAAVRSKLLDLAGEIAAGLARDDIAATGRVLAHVMDSLDRLIEAADG